MQNLSCENEFILMTVKNHGFALNLTSKQGLEQLENSLFYVVFCRASFIKSSAFKRNRRISRIDLCDGNASSVLVQPGTTATETRKSKTKIGYSQLFLRRTPLGHALAVRLREMSVL